MPCSRFRKLVQDNYSVLADTIDINEILTYLYQYRIVTMDAKERIEKHGTTRKDKAEFLLQQVCASDNPEVLDIFIRSLEEPYPFLVKELRQHPLTSKHAKACTLTRQHRITSASQEHTDRKIRIENIRSAGPEHTERKIPTESEDTTDSCRNFNSHNGIGPSDHEQHTDPKSRILSNETSSASITTGIAIEETQKDKEQLTIPIQRCDTVQKPSNFDETDGAACGIGSVGVRLEMLNVEHRITDVRKQHHTFVALDSTPHKLENVAGYLPPSKDEDNDNVFLPRRVKSDKDGATNRTPFRKQHGCRRERSPSGADSKPNLAPQSAPPSTTPWFPQAPPLSTNPCINKTHGAIVGSSSSPSDESVEAKSSAKTKTISIHRKWDGIIGMKFTSGREKPRFVDDVDYYVSEVISGKLAEQLGIRVNDTIISLDGDVITNWDKQKVQRYLRCNLKIEAVFKEM